MQKGLKLSSPEVLEDLSSKCNIIYVICAVAIGLLLSSELNFLIGAVLGLIVGWVIKGPLILKSATYKFRTMEFWMPENVSVENIYAATSQLLRGQGIYVTLQGNELEFQHGSIHYQFLQDMGSGIFQLRWYFSAAKALFGERYVHDYKVVRRDMGLIAYTIQNITV
ncbi:MAG: hypothetical protein J6K04_07480 [Lachnospiraceae bacterium]|nr:hypothetical protein [Lachnospiraceae bacterium]